MVASQRQGPLWQFNPARFLRSDAITDHLTGIKLLLKSSRAGARAPTRRRRAAA
jgi:hypothetical protein